MLASWKKELKAVCRERERETFYLLKTAQHTEVEKRDHRKAGLTLPPPPPPSAYGSVNTTGHMS